MIVVVASLVIFAIWTVVLYDHLKVLRAERVEAEGRSSGDHWIGQRDWRAVMAVALWTCVLAFLVGSLTYLDGDNFDTLARLFALTERFVLLVIGILGLYRIVRKRRRS